MGAGSRGEGGGEEEGGGLWAPAPFIAAAGRTGVPCFPSHGGANSCYQQAAGRLQHGGRRHHPVASDRRGGNAGERPGRRPRRPGRGPGRGCGSARSGAGLCGLWEEGAAGGPGAPRALPRLPALGCGAPGLGMGPGRAGRGGAGAAGLAGPGGGVGVGDGPRAELESAGTGRGFARGPLLPRAPGGRGAAPGSWWARRPLLCGFPGGGRVSSLPALLRGCGGSFGTARSGLRKPLLCST